MKNKLIYKDIVEDFIDIIENNSNGIGISFENIGVR